MALLNHPREAPPDGWTYFQRETGSRFEGMNSFELVDLVVAHRRWKKLDRATPEEALLDIHRQICDRMPPGVCQPEPGEVYQPIKDMYRSTTSEVVMAGSKAAIEWLSSGNPPVPQEERDRRGNICRSCPYNRASFCACTPIYALIDALVPKSMTQPGLTICTVCACSLKVKVLAPVNVIEESNDGRNLRFPAWCWQNPDNLDGSETQVQEVSGQ